ncbi:MAG: di-trans,poly-cis-decaprenylcistransferase [Oscillospiraceae bacterium]|jgi:undecaprenyl diphosphate synthase|nr:di-trans,poly-cis-decaprenylcistransferase [Oscillospiraceae bacterium]
MAAYPSLPQHIGIIMDGNGRWAKQRGLPRAEGHKAGVKVFERISEYAAALGIPCLTFYAFSTENWQRPAAEVQAIMALFRRQLDEMEARWEENERKRFRIRYIGDLEPGGPVPEDIIRKLRDMEARARDKDKTIVNIAVNYGGRQEILRAARRAAALAAHGALRPEEISEADLEAGLYTAGQPAPDLIIRPSGELRLSNFLLWQSAYAELWFSDVLWPDFTERDLDTALEDFSRRHRRFGDIGDPPPSSLSF